MAAERDTFASLLLIPPRQWWVVLLMAVPLMLLSAMLSELKETARALWDSETKMLEAQE